MDGMLPAGKIKVECTGLGEGCTMTANGGRSWNEVPLLLTRVLPKQIAEKPFLSTTR